MRKMPSLFVRDFSRKCPALPTVTPGCEWVATGEGIATIKRDGTACLVRAGRLFRRYDCKVDWRSGQRKPPPVGWEQCEEQPDESGHWPGWLPVGQGPADKWYLAATMPTEDGTYELCGPHFQSNPYGLASDTFFRHGGEVVECPRDYAGIAAWLQEFEHEGIVWHHEDGRMVKLKRSDFRLPWPPPKVER